VANNIISLAWTVSPHLFRFFRCIIIRPLFDSIYLVTKKETREIFQYWYKVGNFVPINPTLTLSFARSQWPLVAFETRRQTGNLCLTPIGGHLLRSEEEFHAFPARTLQLDSVQDKYVVSTKGFRESVASRSANEIANQKGKTIRLRSHCSFASRSRWLLYLGKAIKGEQWTDEVGASAMWRPCFALLSLFLLRREDTRKR